MSEETPFKVTIKTPLGTFISVTADDVDTLRERIEAVRTAEDIIIDAETQFGPAQNLKSLTAPADEPQQSNVRSFTPQQQAPAQQPTPHPADAPKCEHGEPAKFVPGGFSQRTQRPYPAFWVCARQQQYQCKFRANG